MALLEPLTTTLPEFARNYLRATKQLFIDGKFVDARSGKTFPVYDPSTGGVLANVAEGDAADIDLAVTAARRAFERGPWRTMSASDRGRLIYKLADAVERRLEDFALLESLDNGKPLAVARVADVPMSVDNLRYMAGWATKINGDTISIPGTFHAYTRREPIGVVGQIIPWNFPLLMAAWKLGPALASGCTIVLKPAEQTPLSAILIAELAAEVGFPPGVLNVVPGYGETAGAALANHPDVDKIAFTGSTEVGKLIVKAAAGNLKKVTLELGGKSPNIIFADADIDAATQGAAFGIFFNMGQCCTAGSRLFVERSVFDQVTQGVAAAAKAMRVGPGLDSRTDIGPLVSDEQLARVTSYIQSGISEGARALSGGSRAGDRGYFVEPTVLVDVKPDMKIMREEIFGPVVAATPFDDPNEILEQANDTVYGLAAGVWTSNVSKAHTVAAGLRAGTVWVNCYNVFDPALPFGGYKQSGWGREMSHNALECYTETKSVVVKL
ncbi:MAG: aldehyde dehydrogenase family protein [Vulcanimicrobiaceae bacterium]|jgi:phenylacetaldehyde dehydrogenase